MTLGKWLGFMTIVGSVYVLWQLRTLVFLFLAAVVIATTLNRLVKRYWRSHVKRGYAVFLSVTVTLGLLSLVVFLIFFRLINQFDQLLELIPISVNQIQVWGYELQSRIPTEMIDNLPDLTNFTRQLQSAASWAIANIYLFFSNSLTLLLNLLIIFVLTLMLLASPQRYRQSLIRSFPAFYRQRADEILSKCEVNLVNSVGRIAFNMFFIGVASTLGLALLKVPLPVVNGLLAGLSAFIPCIGAIISAVPPILLALLVDPWRAIAVLLLYIAIQQVETNFVTPALMKGKGNLLPALTLTLLIVLWIFFGLLGLLLGLPILVVVQTWIEEAFVHDILDVWKTS